MKIFNRFLQFFEDDTKSLSATRLAFLVTIHVVLAMWVVDCIKTGHMVKFDLNTVYLILSLCAAKVGQSFSENKNPQESPK